MKRQPVDETRVKEVAQKLVRLYAGEALLRAKELEKTSSVKAFAEAVSEEVVRILNSA